MIGELIYVDIWWCAHEWLNLYLAQLGFPLPPLLL